jgi:hypothetical protein
VDTGGEGDGLVGDLLRVPEDVDRAAADGGEEDLEGEREGGREGRMDGWVEVSKGKQARGWLKLKGSTGGKRKEKEGGREGGREGGCVDTLISGHVLSSNQEEKGRVGGKEGGARKEACMPTLMSGHAEFKPVGREGRRVALGRKHPYLDVGACDELGVHHVGLHEQRLPQLGLRDTEALGHGRQVPHGLDGGLREGEEEEGVGREGGEVLEEWLGLSP